jgi:Uma2 family endonuclease
MVIAGDKQKNTFHDIPAYLVYEELDGQSLPYRGYLEVLSGHKKIEEIMGSSSLQAVIVYLVGLFIGNNIDRKKYRIASNEAGLHVRVGDNLANDLAIYDKQKVTLNDQYFSTAPKIVVEIDIKVDLSTTVWSNDLEYVLAKSQKMLDFGVEKVIWITTKTKKIFVMSATERWYLVDFNEDIIVLDDCILNLLQLLNDEDIMY